MNVLKRGLVIALATVMLLLPVTTVLASSPFNQTVEGVNSYYVTGESYASNIQFAGYNSRDKKVYTNLALETTKTVSVGSVATFNYHINVFDGASVSLGNLGLGGTLANISAPISSTTAQANNKVITLSSPLTAQFTEVVTVDHVTVTP